MIVNFNKIDIEGFLSIGKSSVDLNDLGIVLVEGKNNSPGTPSSNGAGKSTIFEAIYFTFTGSTIRGTTDVINKYYSEKFCSVTLDFHVDSDHYIVQRTKNHPTHGNNLKISKNDKDISGDKLRKSEQILYGELPTITANLLTSVVIISQGMNNKFTSLKPTARKERLEELSQCSDFINQLKSRISSKSKEVTREINELNCKKASLDTKLDMIRFSINKKVDELNNLLSTEEIEGIKSGISKAQGDLDTNTKKLTEVQGDSNLLETKLSHIRKTINETISDESMIFTKISRLTSEVNKLAVSTCPTCHQHIQSLETVNSLRNNYYTEINELQGKLSETKVLRESLTNNLSLVEGKYNELKGIVVSLSTLNAKLQGDISTLNVKLAHTNSQGDSINNEIAELESNICEVEKELSDLAEIILNTSNKSSMLDYLGKIANKEFRSYLLEGVVDYLNTRVSYYSDRLFGNSRLSLTKDDSRIHVIYDDRPYENLSGGEARRADLAVQFAIRDMLKNSIGFTTNLLVIDEGFDNLDTAGVDSLINTLSDFDDISSVFVVTHHSQLPIPYDKKIVVEKGLDKVSNIVSFNG